MSYAIDVQETLLVTVTKDALEDLGIEEAKGQATEVVLNHTARYGRRWQLWDVDRMSYKCVAVYYRPESEA